MFNKKSRRIFRQRKQSSSDEEEQQQRNDRRGGENAAILISEKLKYEEGSLNSKPVEEKLSNSDEEEAKSLTVVEKEQTKKERTETRNKKSSSALSFSEYKEDDETFEVKKSTDRPVMFQVPKKKDSTETTNNTGVCGLSAVGHLQRSSSPQHTSDRHSLPLGGKCKGDDDDAEDDCDSDESGVKSPSRHSDSDRSTDRPVEIPKSKEIQAAKIQRRTNRTQKDYISLDCDGVTSTGRSRKLYSGENEEHGFNDNDDDDDDDDDLDDHERRIEFAPRPKTIQERMAESMGGSDDSQSATDEEEEKEQELWEETQIGKGMKRQLGKQGLFGSEWSSCSSRPKRAAAPRIPKTVPLVTVSMVKKKIVSKLDLMKELHRRLQVELVNMDADLETARTSVECLSECSSESQLTFYRETALYIHNLVECLREKVVQVNSLELELHVLLSDQMEALLTQRRQNMKEQLEHLQRLNYDPKEQSSETEPQCLVEVTVQSEEEDEQLPHHSTPSAEEAADLQKTIADVMLRSQVVFSDVHEDFSDVRRILSRFEVWRGSYTESYNTAYIPQCLPKLLNPIIRHQLLGWNPLQNSSSELENLQWFTAVETFCYGHGHEQLENIDRKTLSNIIENTVLPKMTVFVELVWDPLSQQQSTCLSDLCHRLKEDYHIFEGELSKQGQALTEAVIQRLKSCVDEELFFPLFPQKEQKDSTCRQQQFRQKQTWTAIKLLANMGKWDTLLPVTSLKELILDKVLNQYLVIALTTGTLTSPFLACKKIADSLPVSWFTGVTTCLPELQNFKNYLVQCVNETCQQPTPEDPQSRSAVVELLQVLSRIRCYESIRTIAEKYHFEDVLYSQQLLNQDLV